MKLIRIATAVLFAGGLIGASASMASADTPFELTDCAVGYEAVLAEDGVSGTCEAIPEPIDETTDGTCWTTPEGGDVCARGGVLGSTEDPVPAVCVKDVEDVGTDSTMCTDWSAYNTLPEDSDGVINDCVTTDESVCYDMMPMVGDESLMYKNAAGMGGSSSNDSNTLAALGVLFGALGAFGIGISNQRTAKK